MNKIVFIEPVYTLSPGIGAFVQLLQSGKEYDKLKVYCVDRFGLMFYFTAVNFLELDNNGF
jgi:hypothetical protein